MICFACLRPSYVFVFSFICRSPLTAELIAEASAERPITVWATSENWTTASSTWSFAIWKPETILLVNPSASCQSDEMIEAEPSRTITTSSLALHGGGGPGGGGGGGGAGGEEPPIGHVSNERTVFVFTVIASSKEVGF